MPFVPLWTSVLRSRKVAALSDDLFRLWITCLLEALEHDKARGTLPPAEDFSPALRRDMETLRSDLERLAERGFLDRRGGGFAVHDWQQWQYSKDPTAAARMRAYRERKRAQAEQREPDAEPEPAFQLRAEPEPKPTPQPEPEPVSRPAEAVRQPEPVPHAIDAVDAAGLRLFGDRWEMEALNAKMSGLRAQGYPDDWIVRALEQASVKSSRGHEGAYILRCLGNWKRLGGPDVADPTKKARASKPEAPTNIVRAPPGWGKKRKPKDDSPEKMSS